MSFDTFPHLSFPGRVFPIEIWQGREQKPEKDGTWAERLDSRSLATARALPELRAIALNTRLSARAKTKPGYHAEKHK
ncbi:hypothetical protein EPN96_06615 [bacterium]|nr:MAG: hypothetical protein EPN96_06615 [bacterium]